MQQNLCEALMKARRKGGGWVAEGGLW